MESHNIDSFLVGPKIQQEKKSTEELLLTLIGTCSAAVVAEVTSQIDDSKGKLSVSYEELEGIIAKERKQQGVPAKTALLFGTAIQTGKDINTPEYTTV